MFPWPHDIAVIGHMAGAEDELGNVIEIELPPVTWRGFFGANTATTDFGATDEPQRFASTVTVLLEPDAVVGAGDDVSYNGRRWRVQGEPIPQTDLQGVRRHWELVVAGYATEELVGS